jgi:ATP-dependent DNA ligase
MVIDDFEMLAPMKYYDNTSPASDNLKQKRLNIINNQDNAYVATKKNDGDWAMLIHYSADNNLIRSRSISKVTGKYGDYTAKLPHIVSEMNKLPDNTVLLAEICWDEIGTDANTVGTILRCLPPKAVERQKDKKLKAVIFDVLMLGDDDLTKKPYFQRLQLLQQFQFPYLMF